MDKKFAVLGYPIGHSLSPMLHNEIFSTKGLAHSYDAVLMPPEELADSFKNLTEIFAGFNCTIPLKEKVIPFLDHVDSHALELGSVNTVKCTPEGTFGYSTDTEGFLRALKAHNVDLSEKKVLIVGCGGVARVIAFACARAGCNITIALRSPEKALSLVNELESKFSCKLNISPLDEVNGSYDLLVQCTPVGMYPRVDFCPVSDEVIANCHVIFDTIYNPLDTLIMKKARLAGKTAINGLQMLVFQGLASQEIWLGLHFTEAEALRLVNLLANTLSGGEAK